MVLKRLDGGIKTFNPRITLINLGDSMVKISYLIKNMYIGKLMKKIKKEGIVIVKIPKRLTSQSYRNEIIQKLKTKNKPVIIMWGDEWLMKFDRKVAKEVIGELAKRGIIISMKEVKEALGVRAVNKKFGSDRRIIVRINIHQIPKEIADMIAKDEIDVPKISNRKNVPKLSKGRH